MLQVLRFFLVIPLVPNAMLLAFGAAAIGGCGAVAFDVGSASRTLAPVILLQLFAAASGFRVPARRGHYDLLFTGGVSRLAVAVVHWTMSVTPGVLAWLALAAGERAAGGSALTTTGTMGAMVMVSTVPWAMTTPLARLSGAIVWLLLAVISAAAVPVPAAPAAAALMPWGLVGARVGATTLAALLAVSATTVGVAVWWIHASDVPLESSQ